MSAVQGTAASAWGPLRHRMFRMLWLAWLVANAGMWMNELASAWLMTTLTTDPVLVGLVRTAATLPAFLLALPSGAIADIVDRRRWFMGIQVWAAIASSLLAVVVWTGAITPSLLLVLVVAYGSGLALRWPAYAAIVPELVPREQLSQAVALNGISANIARIVGPIIAGAVLAWLGSGWVFALNALLSLATVALIWPWRPARRAQTLPAESFVGAMRVGLQFATQSPPLRSVLWHSVLFFLQNAALLGLLPLLVRGLGGGETLFTLCMCALSAGAIGMAASMPRWRHRVPPAKVQRVGTLAYSVATVVAAFAPTPEVAVLAMVPAGAAWMAVSNVLTTSSQFVLPDWVRARGMALYLMASMAGYAGGAALWGAVARYAGVPGSLLACSVLGAVLVLAMKRLDVPDHAPDDLQPLQPGAEAMPSMLKDDGGPVMVTIEYQVDPQDEAEFAEVMRESRRSRLRAGALSWGLLRDAADPQRYVEYFIDENWVEHARRRERLTAADARLREQRAALHRGGEPPKVTRYVGQVVGR